MGEDIKSLIRDYWHNYKSIFPRKSLEEGKTRTRIWAIDLKKELKLDKDVKNNWENYVDQYIGELEGEWNDW